MRLKAPVFFAGPGCGLGARSTIQQCVDLPTISDTVSVRGVKLCTAMQYSVLRHITQLQALPLHLEEEMPFSMGEIPPHG